MQAGSWCLTSEDQVSWAEGKLQFRNLECCDKEFGYERYYLDFIYLFLRWGSCYVTQAIFWNSQSSFLSLHAQLHCGFWAKEFK
jgi:hypothetical protein